MTTTSQPYTKILKFLADLVTFVVLTDLACHRNQDRLGTYIWRRARAVSSLSTWRHATPEPHAMNAGCILCKIIRRRLFSGENRTPLSQRGGKQNEDNLSKWYFKGWQPLCFADDVQEDHSQGSDKDLKGYKAVGAPRAINNNGNDDNKNSLTALCPVKKGRAHVMVKCCLTSSDVSWHIRDKLWPMPKHGSVNLYVHGNQKAR